MNEERARKRIETLYLGVLKNKMIAKDMLRYTNSYGEDETDPEAQDTQDKSDYASDAGRVRQAFEKNVYTIYKSNHTSAARLIASVPSRDYSNFNRVFPSVYDAISHLKGNISVSDLMAVFRDISPASIASAAPASTATESASVPVSPTSSKGSSSRGNAKNPFPLTSYYESLDNTTNERQKCPVKGCKGSYLPSGKKRHENTKSHKKAIAAIASASSSSNLKNSFLLPEANIITPPVPQPSKQNNKKQYQYSKSGAGNKKNKYNR
jgi:hypothetical protein